MSTRVGPKPKGPGFIRKICKLLLFTIGLIDAAGNPIVSGGSAFATVGSGGTYSDVKEATDAGEQCIQIVGPGTVTETADNALPDADIYVAVCAGVLWDTAENRITSAHNRRFTVHLQGGSFRYQRSTGQRFFEGQSGSIFSITGDGSFENQSAQSDTPLCSEDTQQNYNGYFDFTVPNLDRAGVRFGSGFSQAGRFNVIGSGTSCDRAWEEESNARGSVEYVRFQGSFRSTGTGAMVTASPNGQATKYGRVETELASNALFVIESVVLLWTDEVPFSHTITLAGDARILSGAIRAGTINMGQFCQIKNCEISQGFGVLKFASGQGAKVVDCYTTGVTLLIVDNSFVQIIGCDSGGSIRLSGASAANSVVDRCILGNKSTGGSASIDIQSGCSNYSVTNNRVEQAVTDTPATGYVEGNFVY